MSYERLVKGWFDLKPDELVTAIQGLTRQNFRSEATNKEMVLGRVADLLDGHHITEDLAQSLRDHVNEVAIKRRR